MAEDGVSIILEEAGVLEGVSNKIIFDYKDKLDETVEYPLLDELDEKRFGGIGMINKFREVDNDIQESEDLEVDIVQIISIRLNKMLEEAEAMQNEPVEAKEEFVNKCLQELNKIVSNLYSKEALKDYKKNLIYDIHELMHQLYVLS